MHLYLVLLQLFLVNDTKDNKCLFTILLEKAHLHALSTCQVHHNSVDLHLKLLFKK